MSLEGSSFFPRQVYLLQRRTLLLYDLYYTRVFQLTDGTKYFITILDKLFRYLHRYKSPRKKIKISSRGYLT